MKRIFIAGATGFIGSHLVNRLGKSGDYKLSCLVRKTSKVSRLKQLGATLATGDVTNKHSLLEGMKGCDWVINLANIYSYWEPNRRSYTDVNVTGTRNVMEAALEAAVSKVVHISTLVVYGQPSDSPFMEESPVGPVRFSEYARTKYAGELAAWELFHKRGLPLVVIYPAAALGPGDTKATGQYIRALTYHKLPATVFSDRIMMFVHVRDVVEAIIRAAEKEGNIGEKYLVGKAQLTYGQCNKMVSEISGTSLPKMHLPDFLAMTTGGLCTFLANVIKKPPVSGMAIDQLRTMSRSLSFDGSKAERELGISYTPIRVAFEEAIASYRKEDVRS